MEAQRPGGRAGIEAQRSGVRAAMEVGSAGGCVGMERRDLELWNACKLGGLEVWRSGGHVRMEVLDKRRLAQTRAKVVVMEIVI